MMCSQHLLDEVTGSLVLKDKIVCETRTCMLI